MLAVLEFSFVGMVGLPSERRSYDHVVVLPKFMYARHIVKVNINMCRETLVSQGETQPALAIFLACLPFYFLSWLPECLHASLLVSSINLSFLAPLSPPLSGHACSLHTCTAVPVSVPKAVAGARSL